VHEDGGPQKGFELILNALNDDFGGGDLLRPFLELWLEMEGKYVAIPSCGLMILEKLV